MLSVNPSLPTPPFVQIREQISAQRASGELPAGERLPPVRSLAADLGLAPGTVARAYRELEIAGVIETRGRQGSFVVGTAESVEKSARAAATAYVATLRDLDVDEHRALTLVRQAFAGG